MTRPLPENKGVGFTEERAVIFQGYRYEQMGRYHNYFFTGENFTWPINYPPPAPIVMDGFSPNLNKLLHVGHLRNLALAKSFSVLFANGQFVSLLGESLGIEPNAAASLQDWLSFVNYRPQLYTDRQVSDQFPVDKNLTGVGPGTGEYENCIVWTGPKGPVVIRRSDGRTTYAYHDLAFANVVRPTHYLTGLEQREHFVNLGLGHKHLPMGLVLDPTTGKKMKSRDGTALNADEALKMVIDRLEETPEPRKLAWNVLAWNFLHVGRAQDVRFAVEQWTKPEQPGLYITYTLARLNSVLDKISPAIANVDPVNLAKVKSDLTPSDIRLLGYAAYYPYWWNKAVEAFDPAPLANYTHELARTIGNIYHSEQIVGGRPSFQYAIAFAARTLRNCICDLGMFPLEGV